jgi:hypothetical protein
MGNISSRYLHFYLLSSLTVVVLACFRYKQFGFEGERHFPRGLYQSIKLNSQLHSLLFIFSQGIRE